MKKRWVVRTSVMMCALILTSSFAPLTTSVSAGSDYKRRTPSELDTLAGPIALYPDILLAQILPASTFVDQVIQANTLINVKKAGVNVIDAQPWDSTVKAVARYPQVLTTMTNNLDWTGELGDVFMHQQKDLFDAIQQLRVKARANGVLNDTKEQVVIIEQSKIIIAPANPEVVYVPVYNTQVVYVDSGVSKREAAAIGLLSFGAGLALGAWIGNDCNWHGGYVYHSHGCYHPGYGYRRVAVVTPYGGVVAGPNGAVAWRRPAPYVAPVYNTGYRRNGDININIDNSVNRNTNIRTGDIKNTNIRNSEIGNRDVRNSNVGNSNVSTREFKNNNLANERNDFSNSTRGGTFDSNQRGSNAVNSSERGAQSRNRSSVESLPAARESGGAFGGSNNFDRSSSSRGASSRGTGDGGGSGRKR